MFLFPLQSVFLDVTYCNNTFDSLTCWPPAPAGVTLSQKCPPGRHSNLNKYASRQCGPDGLWLGRGEEPSNVGWTNYTLCLPPQILKMIPQVFGSNDTQSKYNVAYHIRILEIVGYVVSLILLLMSMLILGKFKSLRNMRTRIHMNLFAAMLVIVLIKLALYADQLMRSDVPTGYKGIENYAYVCEGSYILLEYAISSMFLWMFVEGIYLHSLVSKTVLNQDVTMKQYLYFAWGVPVLLTVAWAYLTGLHFSEDDNLSCWYGYNFIGEYWINQGPRLFIILVNFIILLKIIYVIILKLQVHDENRNIVRKSARAALVLLPLLGITNILSMVEPDLDSNLTWFTIRSFSTHFLQSFQGSFVAVLYCLSNGEVRNIIHREYVMYVFRRIRRNQRRRSEAMAGAGDGVRREYIEMPATKGFVTEEGAAALPNPRWPEPWSRIELNPTARHWIVYDTVPNLGGPGGMLVPRHLCPDNQNGDNNDSGNDKTSNRSKWSTQSAGPSIQSNGDMVTIGVSDSNGSGSNGKNDHLAIMPAPNNSSNSSCSLKIPANKSDTSLGPGMAVAPIQNVNIFTFNNVTPNQHSDGSSPSTSSLRLSFEYVPLQEPQCIIYFEPLLNLPCTERVEIEALQPTYVNVKPSTSYETKVEMKDDSQNSLSDDVFLPRRPRMKLTPLPKLRNKKRIILPKGTEAPEIKIDEHLEPVAGTSQFATTAEIVQQHVRRPRPSDAAIPPNRADKLDPYRTQQKSETLRDFELVLITPPTQKDPCSDHKP